MTAQLNRRQAVGLTTLATLGIMGTTMTSSHANTTYPTQLHNKQNLVITNGKLTIKSHDTRTVDHTSSTTFWFKPQWWSNFYARSIARRSNTSYYTALVTYKRGKATLSVEKYVNGQQMLLHHAPINPVYSPRIELYTQGDATTGVTLKARVRPSDNTDTTTWDVELRDENKPLTGTETGYSFYISNLTTSNEFYIMNLKHAYEHTGTPPLDTNLWGNIVFEDTFEGNSVDTTKWNVLDETYLGFDSGWITKDNAQVYDGALHMFITKRDAPKRTRNGVDSNGVQLYKERPYNTAFLDTRGIFSQVYGRWEFRAKIPASPGVSAGVWGGVWLRPDDRTIQGEIDIAESFGSHNSETRTSIDVSNITTTSLHFSQNGKDHISKRIPNKGQNLEHEWHTWTFERTPESFKYYFDHELYYTVNVKDYQAKMDTAFPVDKPFGILINMQAASSGSYWGAINDSTILPATMHIDYIRAWEYIGN